MNYNVGELLYDCLRSISKSIDPRFALEKVVVVDNASKEKPVGRIRGNGLPIELILNENNIGFAAACNQGAKGAEGVDYILFLNPDTQLFPDSLSGPIAFMERPENTSIGICGVRLVDEMGDTATSAARFPTLRVLAGGVLGLATVLPSLFPAHFMTAEELHESKTVDQVNGAFFLIRKSVFNSCKGFDESFFLYFEEVDLSFRAKRLGYSSFLISTVTAFHKGGGCSDNFKAARLGYLLSSRMLYAKKHYAAIPFFLVVILTVIELPLRLIQSVIRRSKVDAQNTLVAYRKLIRNLFQRR